MADWGEVIRSFEKVFASFFPELCADPEAMTREITWLEDRFFGSAVYPLRGAHLADARRELQTLEAALLVFSRLDASSDAVFYSLHQLNEDQKIIYDFISKAYFQKERYEKAVSLFMDVVRKKVEIDTSSRTNWEGVYAVESLSVLWFRNKGKRGPRKALNPASEFADFLRSGFRYLDVSADPISAFRAWAKTYGKVT